MGASAGSSAALVAAVAVGLPLAAWFGFSDSLGIAPPFDVEDSEMRKLVFVLFMAGPAVLAVPLYLLWLRVRTRREARWLRSLPFAFAHEGYVHMLAEERDTTSLELVLRFTASVRRETIAALAESCGLGSTPRQDTATTMRLGSPTFTSGWETLAVISSGVGVTYTAHSNEKLHQWFRRRAAPMLIELWRSHGLHAVEIRR